MNPLIDALYKTANGALVETSVRGQIYRGEFYLEKFGDKPMVEKDQITLQSVVEHPSGRKLVGARIQFNVGSVQTFRVLEFGVFRRRREDNSSPMVNMASAKPGPSFQHQNNGYVYGHGFGRQRQRYNENTRYNVGPKYREFEKNKIPVAPKELNPIEIQLKACVIKDLDKLKILMGLMNTEEICGLSLEGENVGRYGKVPWVVIIARKATVPLYIATQRETNPGVWKVLDHQIFSNEKLIKVMHDSRRACDYLFHVHGIKIVNVYDTQAADTFIVHQQTGAVPDKLKSLADCLAEYNRKVPQDEMEFLQKYEEVNLTCTSPFCLRELPPPEFLKVAAIKVKYLVPLRENMMDKLLENFTKCMDNHREVLKHCSSDEYPSGGKDNDNEQHPACSRPDLEADGK